MEKLILDGKKLFVDDLDGKWSLGYDFGADGTRTICVFNELDDWLYPENLDVDGVCFDNVLNVYLHVDGDWCFDVYTLPDNWKDIVANDGGKDGKASILDIMIGSDLFTRNQKIY